MGRSIRFPYSYGFVGVEALRFKAMSGSARGSIAKLGKNVAAKRGPNREIFDWGWGGMRRQVAYKLGWAGLGYWSRSTRATPRADAWLVPTHHATTGPSRRIVPVWLVVMQ